MVNSEFQDVNSSSERNKASEFIIPHETFSLDNGLFVIVHEDRTLPEVTVNIVYQVGSKDEPDGRKGFAHLFEHLMFGGSTNHPGSYLKNMLDRGAYNLNGTTSKDRTNYYQTVPTSLLDYVLFAESDRMGYFIETLSQETLSTQQGVVINEKSESEDKPYGMNYFLRLRSMYPPGHPYAHPVIGLEDDILNASLQTAHQWYKQYYHPANAILTLTGDIDLETAKNKVKHYFGNIPAGPVIPSVSTWVPEMKGNKSEVFYDNVPFAKMDMVWHIPPYGDDDTYYFMFLSDILTGNDNARLKKRLQHSGKLVDSISSWVEGGLVSSNFLISLRLSNIENRAIVESIIKEEIEELLANGPTEQELALLRTSWPIEYIKHFETASSVADILSSSKLMLGSADGYQDLFNCLKSTSIEKIKLSAQRWLANGHYTMWTLPRNTHQKIAVNELRDKIPESGQISVPVFPKLHRSVLKNGLVLTVAERHTRQLVSLNASIQVGKIHQPLAQRGLIQCLTMLLQRSGAQDRTFEQLTEYMISQGFDLSISADYRSINISISCMSSQLVDALKILGDCLFHSRLSKEAFAKIKQEAKNSLVSLTHQPGGIFNYLRNTVMYGKNHAFSFEPTQTTLDELEFDFLYDFYKEYFKTELCELIVTGDTSAEEITQHIDTLWGSTAKLQDRLPIPGNLEYSVPKSSKIYLIDKPDAEQSMIGVMQHLPELDLDSRRDFNALHAIFCNGFSSRINMNLREDKNWTYGVAGIRQNWMGVGFFGLTANIQKDKTVEAMNEILNDANMLIGDKKITQEELRLEIDSSLARLGNHIATVKSLANYIHFLKENDLSDGYLLDYRLWAQDVTVNRLNERAKILINPNHFVWVIIGDASLIYDPIKESGIGEVEILKIGIDEL
jgi:predicted Zn-dependent peptidase